MYFPIHRLKPAANVSVDNLFQILPSKVNHPCLPCPTAGGRQAGILMSGFRDTYHIPDSSRGLGVEFTLVHRINSAVNVFIAEFPIILSLNISPEVNEGNKDKKGLIPQLIENLVKERTKIL